MPEMPRGAKSMSNFYKAAKARKARKQRPCIFCAEPINKGDEYTFQSGNYEGSWYDNHFHHECFDDFIDSGDGEFTPYSNERTRIEA
jgi:hypothetical protein